MSKQKFPPGSEPLDLFVSLGRAVVRAVTNDGAFRCYVTLGVIARSARIRVIRKGIRIYPTSGRLDLLRKVNDRPGSSQEFQNDVHEVPQHAECELRVSNCELSIGDVVEAYRG